MHTCLPERHHSRCSKGCQHNFLVLLYLKYFPFPTPTHLMYMYISYLMSIDMHRFCIAANFIKFLLCMTILLVTRFLCVAFLMVNVYCCILKRQGQSSVKHNSKCAWHGCHGSCLSGWKNFYNVLLLIMNVNISNIVVSITWITNIKVGTANSYMRWKACMSRIRMKSNVSWLRIQGMHWGRRKGISHRVMWLQKTKMEEDAFGMDACQLKYEK